MMRRLDQRTAARPTANGIEPGKALPAVSLVLGDGPGAERISGTKLLIGSDVECDVRLDDPTAPELHSMIHSDRDGVWLDVVISDPPAYVNGEETEWARLSDGDVIEIGLLEMTVRICELQGAAVATQAMPMLAREPEAQAPALRSADVAAAERKQAGARAMLQAALHQHMGGALSDDEDDDRDVLPIRGRMGAVERRDEPTESMVDPGQLDRIVMELEELAARTELLARDLELRMMNRGLPAREFLKVAEKTLDELERLMESAESNAPILNASKDRASRNAA